MNTPDGVSPPDLRISVVTINRNTGDAVSRTIASILAQDHPLEWVVVDGASTDGSIGLLRQAIRPGDILVSEPDQGISDAFNKGIARATGDAVLFMNAGDAFASPQALRQLVERWDRSHFRWITGTAEVVTEQGQALFVRPAPVATNPRDLIRRDCRVFHQATLVERRLLLDHGGFDRTFRIAMDFDLWCRLLAARLPPQVVPVVVCRYHVGGASADVMTRLGEFRRARAAHGFANPWHLELRLFTIACLKAGLRGLVGGWAYRLKERLGW